MKKFTLYAFACILLFGCQKETLETASNTNELLSSPEIEQIIFKKLHAENEFWWQMVSDQVVWSALSNSDGILSIGYQPRDYQNLNSTIHQIDLQSSEWIAAREEVIAIIEKVSSTENIDFTRAANVRIKDNLPVIQVKTKSLAVVKALRAEKSLVRYADPMGYSIEPDVNHNSLKNDSGCGNSGSSNINSNDYTTISPGVKRPWTFDGLNVSAAWNYSQGNNIGVALLDTGTSDNQSKLRSKFTAGQSGGRYIDPQSTHVTEGWWWWEDDTLDSPHDQCGHGTQMGGTIAAPRTGGGATVGVAYKANLIPYRCVEDVVINTSSEKDGVSDALVNAANRSDVHIVSMSLGDVISNGQVADAIRYANNSGVLIFAAAGTSLSWTSWWGVIFPAWMSETVAVTGVTDANNYQRCASCHDGSQVDFVVAMQRANNSSRTSLTLANSGNTPSYVGGSSTATAHTAGVAALIWATNPGFNKTAVLNRLKNASENYPSRSGSYGYGKYDALVAVRGY